MSVKKKENQILQWFVKPINSIFRNNSCSPNFASKQRYKIRPFIFSFSRLKEQVNIKKKNHRILQSPQNILFWVYKFTVKK